MISFSIFEVERQKFFIHATCFVILVNLNLIIFLFCPHFKYLPFPNVCHSSLYSAVKNIVSRIQNILSWLLQKHQGLAERCKTFRTRGGLRGDPVFWIVKRNLITPQWMEPPAVTSVAPDWTPSWIASIPNKYNPWICFVSIFDLPDTYSDIHWEWINWISNSIPQHELVVVQRDSVFYFATYTWLHILTVMTSRPSAPPIWHPGVLVGANLDSGY